MDDNDISTMARRLRRGDPAAGRAMRDQQLGRWGASCGRDDRGFAVAMVLVLSTVVVLDSMAARQWSGPTWGGTAW